MGVDTEEILSIKTGYTATTDNAHTLLNATEVSKYYGTNRQILNWCLLAPS